MNPIPESLEAVAVAYQSLCRAVDAASDAIRTEHRASPALPAYDFILRSVCATTLPKAVQRLAELERGMRRGDPMENVLALLRANPHLLSK